MEERDNFKPILSLVIYKNDKASYIESHSIKPNGKLGPGSPLMKESLFNLLQATSADYIKQETLEILPSNILVNYNTIGKSIIGWYVPGKKRTLQFDFENHKSITTIIPNLILIVVNKTLFVYAYKGDNPPSDKTKIYYAPFPNNDWKNGVCLGTVKKQSFTNVKETIAYYDRAYFYSQFTHALSKTHEKDWIKASQDGFFNPKVMKTTKLSLKQIIDNL